MRLWQPNFVGIIEGLQAVYEQIAGKGDLIASATSAPNAAATATIFNPGAGNSIHLVNIYFGYRSAPTNGLLTIAATGLNTITIPVTAAGAGFLPIPLKIPTNTSVTITLSAGGSGVIGDVGAIYQIVA